MKRLLLAALGLCMMISLSGCEGEYQVGDLSIAYHSTKKQSVTQEDLNLVDIPFVIGNLLTGEYKEVFSLELPEDLVLKEGKDNLGTHRYDTSKELKEVHDDGDLLSYAVIEDGKYFCDQIIIENYSCELDFDQFVTAYLYLLGQDDIEKEDSKQEAYECTTFDYTDGDTVYSYILVATKVTNVYYAIEMIGTKQSAIASGEELKQFMYDYGVMAAKEEA